MILKLKGFSQLVQDMAAALQGSATALVDVSVGSVLRALIEANASVALWLQWLLLQILQTTRAATSVGTDLDSWMADFNLSRLPATAATGQVTFSRFADNAAATVPIGTVVKTTDGSVSFAVVADTTISTWRASSNGYIIPAGVSSATVPVGCLTSGSLGNVLANSITVIASSLPGVDQVININALSDGYDAESDDHFRARFRDYLASLSRATLLAVQNSAASVQQNLQILVEENVQADGSPAVGSFLVVVDDGSGYPSASLLSAVATSVEGVRPIGTTFAVVAPGVLTVDVQLSAQISDATLVNQYSAAIQQGIAAYLNSLPIGGLASVTRIAQKGYGAGPSVENIHGVTLNGQTSDLAVPATTVIKAGQVTVLVDAG